MKYRALTAWELVAPLGWSQRELAVASTPVSEKGRLTEARKWLGCRRDRIRHDGHGRRTGGWLGFRRRAGHPRARFLLWRLEFRAGGGFKAILRVRRPDNSD